MLVEKPPRPLTYEDLEQITDTRHRYAILQGELIVTDNPFPVHVLIATDLSARLFRHIQELRLGELFGGPVDIRFSKHDIVAPDLSYVSNERSHIIRSKLLEGAPDLVIEILSPSTRAYDRGRKLALYSAGGVREYWIVDREAKSIQVWNFQGHRPEQTTFVEASLRSAVLPDVMIDVEDLFGNLPVFPDANEE